MKNLLSKLIVVVGIFLLLPSCKDFLGNKTDVSFIEVPDYSAKPVSYVPILPIISSFTDPVDVATGYDQLMYVVDAGTEQIITYDESLKELSRLKIPGVKRVVQDRKLDLIALGTLDTAINGIDFKLACAYKINLKNNIYGLSQANIYKKIVHPFYVNNQVKLSDNEVRFTGVAVLGDNSFYVTRTGQNSTNLIGGPDDAIIYFDDKNKYQYYVQVQTSEGLRDDFIKSPKAITSFVMPPQSSNANTNKGFAYVTDNPTDPIKVKLINYEIIDGSPAFTLRTDLVIGDTSQASGFLYSPNKFKNPSAITFSGDGTQNIFVTDTGTDSVYVFSNTGLEGIKPPPGSTSTKFVNASFGGNGIGALQFTDPVALAYSEKFVFVIDRANHRLMRFKLTTDLR